MVFHHRQFKLRIWWLALGYFLFYVPYSFLIKVLTTRSWPGINGPVSGFRLLPAVVLSTALVLTIMISVKGWWKYVGRRQFFGRALPFPASLVFLSGLGTAIIIGTTTLAFSFTGVSIVFALVLMRGGVLMIAPVVDLAFRRRIRWFSWTALALTAPALLVAFSDVDNSRLTVVAKVVIAAYLTGYLMRLPCLTKLAKTYDSETTHRYFVEELMVALVFLIAIPVVLALIGRGEIMQELRHGFTDLFVSNITFPALLIGALYGCLYCFGTMLYLDCRENTFCIPLNRGASMLAGVVASFALAAVLGQGAPSQAQLMSASMIGAALLFLSPLHHFQRTVNQLKHSLASVYGKLLDLLSGAGRPEPVGQSFLPISMAGDLPLALSEAIRGHQPGSPAGVVVDNEDKLRRLFLFVCSGNTCRSPMAAAIANAEIAARLQIPFEALETVNARALSAGVSARVGAPLTPEAQEVLRSLDVPARPHAASNLTVELANQAEMIFCMTSAHRKAVIDMIPAVAGKTYCLDAQGDIDDPIGKGMPAYLNCARRIHDLVRLRFDQLSLPVGLQV